tara:strand:- start:2141 stop:2797 length:657 start_codon:yes stop_codon:yes gene_type:complete
VGTLPPPRFTTGELKAGDVNFCYGSRDGQLWPILDRLFGLSLRFENTEEAVRQRMDFLRERKIGICDIVESAERIKIDASDLGMQDIKLRDLLSYLYRYPLVDTLLFTGGNSKNGPEYFFRKHLKSRQVALQLVCDEVPRIHEFVLPRNPEAYLGGNNEEPQRLNQDGLRIIKTVSLTAPSGAANRAVGSLVVYKKLKDQNPDFNTVDFRALQYKPFF